MIKQKLVSDQIAAMKSKNAAVLEILRYILAQIKNAEVDTKADLSDEAIQQLIRKEIKKLQDAIVPFQKAHRSDLVDEYQGQIDILNQYLPAQISDEDLMKEITKVMEKNAELAATNPNAMIGLCARELKSVADSSHIASLVRQMRV